MPGFTCSPAKDFFTGKSITWGIFFYKLSLINLRKNLKITLFGYNCLYLYQVFVTCHSVSLKQEKCLEKVTKSQPSASNLLNLFSTQFSWSQELGKHLTHAGKNFSHDKSRQLLQQSTNLQLRLLSHRWFSIKWVWN